ncbi:MAG: hypothetical protein HYV28_21120 [Ignavibacteriales bacterium]|nr:hypothetical protein [Ignavibacteriales bacterium]
MIRDATQKPVLVIWQGVVQSVWNGAAVEDTMTAPLNALSDHYSIKFLDANKSMINAPASTDYKLGLVITDTSAVGYVQDSPTDWAFHLKGKKTGTTTIELQVQHAGHVDVKTPKFHVTVVADTSVHGAPVGLQILFEEDETLIAKATAAAVTGSFTGQKDSTSDHIAIEFFDANNHYFQPEAPLYSWNYTLSDPSVAAILPQSGEPWVFRIKGLKSGQTTLTLRLLLGNTVEFVPLPISIVIQ